MFLKSITAATSLGLLMVTLTTVQAQNITGPIQVVSAASSVALSNANGGALSPDPALRDGIVNGTAGTFVEFQGQLPGATFRFGLNQDYDLNAFYLWNDRGFPDSGMDAFTLTMRDSGLVQIGSTVSLNASSIFQGNNPVPEVFSLGSVYANTRFVDLSIQTGLNNPGNLQFREVAFNAVPEPSTLFLCAIGFTGMLSARRKKSSL